MRDLWKFLIFCVEMLSVALGTLKQKDYSFADVLIINDFIFPQPSTATIEAINLAHKNGTRFYGLKIGNHQCSIESFLTYIWSVNCWLCSIWHLYKHYPAISLTILYIGNFSSIVLPITDVTPIGLKSTTSIS